MKNYPHLAKTLWCMFRDNYGAHVDRFVRPEDTWSIPENAELLEKQAASLSDIGKETLAAGEETEKESLVVSMQVQELDKYLGEVFDGELSGSFGPFAFAVGDYVQVISVEDAEGIDTDDMQSFVGHVGVVIEAVTEHDKCEQCKGTGVYKGRYTPDDPTSEYVEETCEDCDGKGYHNLCLEEQLILVRFVGTGPFGGFCDPRRDTAAELETNAGIKGENLFTQMTFIAKGLRMIARPEQPITTHNFEEGGL